MLTILPSTHVPELEGSFIPCLISMWISWLFDQLSLCHRICRRILVGYSSAANSHAQSVPLGMTLWLPPKLGMGSLLGLFFGRRGLLWAISRPNFKTWALGHGPLFLVWGFLGELVRENIKLEDHKIKNHTQRIDQTCML